MQRVKSFGVLSAAKIGGALYTLIGLILVPFLLIGGVFNLAAGQAGEGVGLLVFAILAPLFYGAFGFVGVALMTFLYNLVAGKVGGIEVELQ